MSVALAQETKGYKIFRVFNLSIIFIFCLLCLYPFLYTFSLSVSSSNSVLAGEVSIFPIGFQLEAYKEALSQPYFIRAYGNTILYTVVATTISLLLTVLCAYPLSKKDLPYKNIVMVFIMITMFFNGGLIPNYLLISSLGFIDSIWAIVLPQAIIQFYMVILMVNFRGIPKELEEAAMMDGYNPIQILFKIVLPLSLPALVTIGLFVVLYQWNSWFQAMIYLNSQEKFPVMLILRNLVKSGTSASSIAFEDGDAIVGASLKSAAIMLVSLPVIAVYPFVQKFFIKGLLIGSIKG